MVDRSQRRFPNDFNGAYQCQKHTGLYGMVAIDPFSDLEFVMGLIENTQKGCKELYGGVCDPNCSVEQLKAHLLKIKDNATQTS